MTCVSCTNISLGALHDYRCFSPFLVTQLGVTQRNVVRQGVTKGRYACLKYIICCIIVYIYGQMRQISTDQLSNIIFFQIW